MKHGLLLLLAACGRYGFGVQVDAGDGDGSAGTRLKQTYNVYEDGFRQPTQTLYDSLLGTKCDVQATTAGLRCLPLPASYPRYADAACTEPIAVKDSADELYAFDTSYPPAMHAYTFGASLGIPAAEYALGYDGSCSAAQAPTDERFALEEISFDRFALVTAQLGTEGRLVSQSLVSDDGFRMEMLLHDTQLDADCIGSVFDDATVCFPTPTDFSWYYADNTCSQNVELAYVPVKFAQAAPTLSACKTTDFTIRALTAELPTTTPIWIGPPAAPFCATTGVPAGRRVFGLGAPISLPPITRQPHPGTRIQFIEDTANGATANNPFYLWDSQLGTQCEPSTAADGMQRCLPSPLGYVTNSYYTDAACTQPIAAVGYGAPECSSYPVQFVGDTTGNPPGPRIYTAVRVFGTAYQGGPTNCQAFPNTDMYTEGTELPPEMFSLVTQATDP
jgi:hypothetical protein